MAGLELAAEMEYMTGAVVRPSVNKKDRVVLVIVPTVKFKGFEPVVEHAGI